MREIEDFINRVLSGQQRKYYPAIQWLVNDGPRASGRTFVLCFALVVKAIQTGQRVHIMDHYEKYRERDSYTLDTICKIVEFLNQDLRHHSKPSNHEEFYDLKINRQQRCFTIIKRVSFKDEYDPINRIT